MFALLHLLLQKSNTSDFSQLFSLTYKKIQEYSLDTCSDISQVLKGWSRFMLSQACREMGINTASYFFWKNLNTSYNFRREIGSSEWDLSCLYVDNVGSWTPYVCVTINSISYFQGPGKCVKLVCGHAT